MYSLPTASHRRGHSVLLIKHLSLKHCNRPNNFHFCLKSSQLRFHISISQIWLREKIWPQKDVRLSYQWTFLSNISQSDEPHCQWNSELRRRRFIGIWKYINCIFQFGLLKNGTESVYNFVLLVRLGLSVLAWGWLPAHHLCVIPFTTQILSLVAWALVTPSQVDKGCPHFSHCFLTLRPLKPLKMPCR